MQDRHRRNDPDAPAQRHRRAPCFKRRSSAAPRDRPRDAHPPDALERLAQTTIGVGDQQGQSERASPGLPFRDDVGPVGGMKERERQGRIGMFEPCRPPDE